MPDEYTDLTDAERTLARIIVEALDMAVLTGEAIAVGEYGYLGGPSYTVMVYVEQEGVPDAGPTKPN